ncbi:MAG: hypothetical protein HY246_23340 [Proteobacteria bacterium]|nr:hypothetical protein [Pseudomonadota bacterium]
MRENRAEAAAIIGKAYKLDTKVMLTVLQRLIDEGEVNGVPYWGLGNFDYPGMENMIRAARLNDMIVGDVDLKKMVDESFLPADLRTKAR